MIMHTEETNALAVAKRAFRLFGEMSEMMNFAIYSARIAKHDGRDVTGELILTAMSEWLRRTRAPVFDPVDGIEREADVTIREQVCLHDGQAGNLE